jgi:hypothetical protein
MSETTSKINFRTVVSDAVGTTRNCNDGSGCDSFTLSRNAIEGITENLDQWWNESYPEIESTIENAREYFNEIYPEI